MRVLASSTLVLFLVWLAWSGHYEPLTVTLGVVSCLLVAFLIARMELLRNARGLFRIPIQSLFYLPWLVREIVRANLDVALRILHPRLPIDPEMVRIPADQKTSVGRTVYANSITLTPGTVSVDVQDDTILVHALTGKAARSLEDGEMGRRVVRMEGPD